jgi:integrase
MPPIQRVNAARDCAAQAGLTQKSLYELSDDEIAGYMITFPSDEVPRGCIFDDMTWIWPATAYPGARSKRTLNFARLASYPVLGAAVRRCILALKLFPLERYHDIAGLRKRTDFLVRTALAIGAICGDRRLGEIGEAQLLEAYETVAAKLNTEGRRTTGLYLKEVNALGSRKVIPDYFAEIGSSAIDLMTAGGLGGAPERPESHQNDNYGVYQSLPDAYVAEAGRIWVYYLEDVLPNLIQVFARWAKIETDLGRPRKKVWRGRTGARARTTLVKIRKNFWCDVLSSFQWKDSRGREIGHLPFSTEVAFPPKGLDELMALFSIVQGSLLQAILLLAGGRVSEAETLQRNCLEFKDGLTPAGISDDSLPILLGRTLKLSGLRTGDARDWPIPVRVARAIALQQVIGTYIAPEERSLWVSTNKAYWRKGVIYAFHHVKTFARLHNLDHLLAETTVHPHRFRKTIARLAVLSLTGAPLILREIFGHQDLEGTLKYILSDPEIRREMAKMCMDIQMEQADVVAENLDAAGGKGAAHLRKVRDEWFDSIKVPQNERQQRRRMDEFVAAKLTDGSIDLKMIFPGLVCLKPRQAIGACRGKELRASACQASCTHFLALPSQRPSIELSIEWLIEQLQRPDIQTNPLLSRWFARYRQDPRCQTLLGEAVAKDDLSNAA